MANIVNPFAEIYRTCNIGNSKYKSQNLPDFPAIIDIELTNTCNFRCLMCPTGLKICKRNKGFMKENVFFKFLEEIKLYKTPVRFIRWGEPTLHLQFKKFISALKAEDILCHINTNGTTLNRELIEFLLEVKLDSIKFSFQGVNNVTYREMRNTDFFEELCQKIITLHKMRGKRKYPYIQVSTTTTYEDSALQKSFTEKFSPYADEVTVGKTKLSHLNLQQMNISKETRQRLQKLRKQESIEKYHFECPEVFDKLSLNWDGSVSACCADYDNFLIVGDILKSSLKEIWKSDKLNYIRKMLSEMRHDELSLCKDCYDTMGLYKSVKV